MSVITEESDGLHIALHDSASRRHFEQYIVVLHREIPPALERVCREYDRVSGRHPGILFKVGDVRRAMELAFKQCPRSALDEFPPQLRFNLEESTPLYSIQTRVHLLLMGVFSYFFSTGQALRMFGEIEVRRGVEACTTSKNIFRLTQDQELNEQEPEILALLNEVSSFSVVCEQARVHIRSILLACEELSALNLELNGLVFSDLTLTLLFGFSSLVACQRKDDKYIRGLRNFVARYGARLPAILNDDLKAIVDGVEIAISLNIDSAQYRDLRQRCYCSLSRALNHMMEFAIDNVQTERKKIVTVSFLWREGLPCRFWDVEQRAEEDNDIDIYEESLQNNNESNDADHAGTKGQPTIPTSRCCCC